MLRALCLAMAMALPLAYASGDSNADLGANAALKYWQAFATLPRISGTEEATLVHEWLTMPLDADARKMVTKAAYALRIMHRGAALPRCDWAVGWDEAGFENLLPYLQGGRVLASLACLRARMRFEEGASGAAIDDIVAAMTLGRHITLDGSLVSIVTNYSIERHASEALALYLPKLDPKTIRDLQKRLGALPPGGSLATGVREEQTLETGWLVRQIKEAKDKESLLALLTRLCDSPEKARALLAECGGTAAGVFKCAEETRQSYALLAKMMELPLDQFEEAQEREARKRAGNPVFKILTPAIIRCRWFQAQADVRRALLAAALAVQERGKGALKDHVDPVAGGPFEYVAFDGGFELRSRWQPDAKVRARRGLDDRPVALTVGRREK